MLGRQKKTEDVFVQTGDICEIAGFYAYKRNPDKNKLPCVPASEDRTLILKKGDIVPPVRSRNGQPGVWKLLGQTKPFDLSPFL